MSDRPPRRILSLKSPPKTLPTPPAARPAPAEQPPPAPQWKCKPCGAAFTPDPTVADSAPIRCPSCNARLGKAGQFRGDKPSESVRARRVG